MKLEKRSVYRKKLSHSDVTGIQEKKVESWISTVLGNIWWETRRISTGSI